MLTLSQLNCEEIMIKRPTPQNWIEELKEYHSPQIDVEVRLNTNESPIPPPEEFFQALTEGVRSLALNRYPDRSADLLCRKLSDSYNLDEKKVFVANGSNEVIQNLLLCYGGAGRSMLVFEPTYAMHSQIARTTGTQVINGKRDENFNLPSGEVVDLIRKSLPSLIFLCSPNNPTGTLISSGLIDEVLEVVGEYGGLVVVDEAYSHFGSTSFVDRVSENASLVVVRTFSKTWAMAGIRLGYLLGPSWCVRDLEKVVLPYHLSSVSQLAGSLALEYRSAMEARVSSLISERERMAEQLGKLEVVLWPSSANFILFRAKNVPGHKVWRGLLDSGVLIRDCSTWKGLEDCLRVTVGTEYENDRFLDALKEAL